MTARQQLAEFNSVVNLPMYSHRSQQMAQRRNFAYKILREHGPMLEELIETARLVHAFPSEGRMKHLGELVKSLTGPE